VATAVGDRNARWKGSRLAARAAVALLVSTGGAGGADDNHAGALAAVFVGRHGGRC